MIELTILIRFSQFFSFWPCDLSRDWYCKKMRIFNVESDGKVNVNMNRRMDGSNRERGNENNHVQLSDKWNCIFIFIFFLNVLDYALAITDFTRYAIILFGYGCCSFLRLFGRSICLLAIRIHFRQYVHLCLCVCVSFFYLIQMYEFHEEYFGRDRQV